MKLPTILQIGDTIYYTFTPEKPSVGRVTAVEVQADEVVYHFGLLDRVGGGKIHNLIKNGEEIRLNAYETMELAEEACKQWRKKLMGLGKQEHLVGD